MSNPELEWQLDKDTLQKDVPYNQRVYSPETCMFLTRVENNSQRAFDHLDETKLSLYGVRPRETSKNFIVNMKVNNRNICFGSYDDKIAAANKYNMVAMNTGRQLNDVPFMNLQEIQSHYTGRGKRMCEIVDNSQLRCMCVVVDKETDKVIYPPRN